MRKLNAILKILGNGSIILFIGAFLLLAVGSSLFTGCGDDSAQKQGGSTGSIPPGANPQAYAESQQEMQRTDATPVGHKFNEYQDSSHDHERQALCDHLKMIPDVLQGSSEGGVITLVLRTGVSQARVKSLAKRIERYMMAHYRGDKSYLVNSVDLHYNIADAPHASEAGGLSGVDPSGMFAASVATGANSSETDNDDTWHIFMGGKEID